MKHGPYQSGDGEHLYYRRAEYSLNEARHDAAAMARNGNSCGRARYVGAGEVPLHDCDDYEACTTCPAVPVWHLEIYEAAPPKPRPPRGTGAPRGKHQSGTYWAARWCSRNLLDGYTCHLVHEQTVPVLFRTRALCRAYIATTFGYIRDRPDLLGEPHGWQLPQAVLVRVVTQ